MTVKVCSKCGIEKDVSEFSKFAKNKDGLQCSCKACKKAYNDKHRADISEYNAKYKIEHKEELIKRSHLYSIATKNKRDLRRELKKEHDTTVAKHYRDTHKEHLNEYTREYYLKNKDRISKRNAEKIRRKCEENPEFKEKLGIRRFVTLSLKYTVLERDNFKCVLCGIKTKELCCHHILPVKVAPNRIEDTNNLVTLCKKCHLYKAHAGDFQKYDKELAQKLLEQVKSRN